MNDINDVYARTSETSGEGEGGHRKRWLIAGLAVGALCLAGGVALAGCSLGNQSDTSATARVADARWAKGITPEWMSAHMGLKLPKAAHSAQAAYETTSRFDTGILTFTLTRAEAEEYLTKYPPEGKWLTPPSSQPTKAPHDFAHLGIAEPETLSAGMRYGDVCPGAPDTTDDPYATSDPQCVTLYAHDYAPSRTRIYVRARYEPGVSPLPEN